MLFKNAIAFYLAEAPSKDMLREAFIKHRFKSARPHEEMRSGWVPVEGNEDDLEADLMHDAGAISLFYYQEQQKILPSSVINDEINRYIADEVKMYGHKPSKKQISDQKIAIRYSLLPKAFSKYKKSFAYIDHETSMVIVGTNSMNTANEVLNLLRASLGTLKVYPMSSKERSHSGVMTDWLRDGGNNFPEKVVPGQEIVLKDVDGSKGSFTKQDLASEEISSCIEAGKKADKVRISWNDYLGITLDTDLVLRKITPLSTFEDDSEDQYEEDFNGDTGFLHAQLLLTVEAMRTMIPNIEKWFEIEKPEMVISKTSEFKSKVFNETDVEDADQSGDQSGDQDGLNEEIEGFFEETALSD